MLATPQVGKTPIDENALRDLQKAAMDAFPNGNVKLHLIQNGECD